MCVLTLYSSHSHWRLSLTAAPSLVSSSGGATLLRSANTHKDKKNLCICPPVWQSVCVCVCFSYQRSLVRVRVFEVDDLQRQSLLSFGHVSFPSSLKQRVAFKLIWTHTQNIGMSGTENSFSFSLNNIWSWFCVTSTSGHNNIFFHLQHTKKRERSLQSFYQRANNLWCNSLYAGDEVETSDYSPENWKLQTTNYFAPKVFQAA